MSQETIKENVISDRRVTISNESKNTPKFIKLLGAAGSIMIPPGESRTFEPHEIPKMYHDTVLAEKIPNTNPIIEVLNAKVPQVIAGLADLSGDELDQLEKAEISGKNRKGIIDAITEERLYRTARAEKLQELEPVLDSGDIESLMRQRELVSGYSDLLELVDARIADLGTEGKNSDESQDDEEITDTEESQG